MVRVAPQPDLADVVEQHWIVSWNQSGRPALRHEVLPDPAVNLVVEPAGRLLYGGRRGPLSTRTDRARHGRRHEVPPGGLLRLSPGPGVGNQRPGHDIARGFRCRRGAARRRTGGRRRHRVDHRGSQRIPASSPAGSLIRNGHWSPRSSKRCDRPRQAPASATWRRGLRSRRARCSACSLDMSAPHPSKFCNECAGSARSISSAKARPERRPAGRRTWLFRPSALGQRLPYDARSKPLSGGHRRLNALLDGVGRLLRRFIFLG